MVGRRDVVPVPVRRSQSGIISQIPIFSFQDASLLRGTRVADVLRRGARVFSDRPCPAEYYGLSRPVDHIDVFISHNWSTPRPLTFLALAFHFNAFAAFVAANVAALIAFVLTCSGHLPIYETHLVDQAKPVRMGVSCTVFGAAAFYIVLFFGHSIGAVMNFRGPTVFLDKTCVCQTDEQLKQRGIESLGAFLNHSWCMLVLYSDVYLHKLWTVYELATYLLLFPRGSLLVQPVYLPLFVIGTMFMSFAHYLAYPWLRMVVVELFHDNPTVSGFVTMPEQCERQTCWFLHMLDFTLILPFAVGYVIVHRRWAYQRSHIKEQVRQFSIHSAICTCKRDRKTVEESIAEITSALGIAAPGATHAESLVEFNALVRHEVPRVLRRSFGRVGVRYFVAVLIFSVQYLTMLDKVSVAVHDASCSPRGIALMAFRGVVLATISGPLLGVAVCVLLVEQSLVFHGSWAVVSVLVISACLWTAGLVLYHILRGLTNWAETSNAGLACLLVLTAVFGLLTWWLFRPVRVMKSRRRLATESSESEQALQDGDAGSSMSENDESSDS